MKTKIKVNHLSKETTKHFLVDLNSACHTMTTTSFLKLFTDYNLEFIEDYEDVKRDIIEIMSAWKKDGDKSELLEVSKFDSHCNFCKIGKQVKVYKWTYKNYYANHFLHQVIYSGKIAFTFDFKDDCLIDFGLCNAYLDDNNND